MRPVSPSPSPGASMMSTPPLSYGSSDAGSEQMRVAQDAACINPLLTVCTRRDIAHKTFRDACAATQFDLPYAHDLVRNAVDLDPRNPHYLSVLVGLARSLDLKNEELSGLTRMHALRPEDPDVEYALRALQGPTLRVIRKEAGLDVRALALRLACTQTELQDVERQKHLASPALAKAIAAEFSEYADFFVANFDAELPAW